MNVLTALKAFLVQVGGSGINNAQFDLNEMLNDITAKTYPFVFWDISGQKFTEDTRLNKRKFSMKCYVVQKFDVTQYTSVQLSDAKNAIWDDLHTKFVAYLNYLNGISGTYFNVIELDKLEGQLYDRGLISVDEEIGIGYTVNFQGWC